jgi:Ca2+-binding EF-hand superfamily protein
MRPIRIPLISALLLTCLGVSSAWALEMMTYTYMDKNRDGKVTRQEWTASSNSFEARDWNNNGVLEGDELRVGYKGKPKKELSFEEAIRMRFEEIDVNNDNILSTWEWPADRKSFDQLDDNGDRTLTRIEFHDRRQEAPDAFTTLDNNRDGVLSKKEAKLDKQNFEWLDDNRDGKITRNEYFDKRAPNQYSFTVLDRNKDGIISVLEWKGSKSDFDRLDTDNNRVITLLEFNGNVNPNRSRANRPGMK